MAKNDTDLLLEQVIATMINLRQRGTRVHCLTNSVARNFTANVLLACGSTPSMTSSPEEVSDFTRQANAVLFNLGTLDTGMIEAMRASLKVCKAEGKPFVLDPVMCHVSPLRKKLAGEILGYGPAVMRANQLEALALNDFNTALTCLALTGEVDKIEYKGKSATVHNGHLFMAKVTAIGCAEGALMAALLGAGNSPFLAALTSLVWFGVAGELAAQKSGGPGSFQPSFIDALHGVSADQIRTMARLS